MHISSLILTKDITSEELSNLMSSYGETLMSFTAVDCNFTDTFIEVISIHCINLTELKLSDCPVTTNCFKVLGRDCKKLTSLWIKWKYLEPGEDVINNLVKNVSSEIRYLGIVRGGRFNEDAIRYLGECYSGSLTSIDISENGSITDANVTTLLQYCKFLRYYKITKKFFN